ncbi:MAG TPA: hypothetical protein DCX29_12295 [Hyphomonas sp.]|nr:hypothetical protein [Hyphomonas sp.]
MRAKAFWQCRGHSGRAAWIARLLFLVHRKRECTASATSEPEDGPIGCAMALGRDFAAPIEFAGPRLKGRRDAAGIFVEAQVPQRSDNASFRFR